MDPHVHTEYSGCYGVSGGRNRLSQQRDMDGHPDDQRRFYRKVCVELTLESGMLTNYWTVTTDTGSPNVNLMCLRSNLSTIEMLMILNIQTTCQSEML